MAMLIVGRNIESHYVTGGAFLVTQMIKNLPAMKEYLLEKKMAMHPSILAWRTPMVRGAWRVAARGITKSQTQLTA